MATKKFRLVWDSGSKFGGENMRFFSDMRGWLGVKKLEDTQI